MKKKQNNDTITILGDLSISKKVMLGVAPAIAVIAILLSKDQLGPMVLFVTGIAIGIIIGVNLKAGQK